MFLTGLAFIFIFNSFRRFPFFVDTKILEVVSSKHSPLEQTAMKFELKGTKFMCELYRDSIGADRVHSVCNRAVKIMARKIFR